MNKEFILEPHSSKTLAEWRGLSILLVLASHLLPLGPKNLQLNIASGVLGMVVFFHLSGFLITQGLIEGIELKKFLIKRFFRIVPLAWLYLIIVTLVSGLNFDSGLSHFLFYANLPDVKLISSTAHLWSLCVEVQFYIGISIVFMVFRSYEAWAIFFLLLLMTGIKIHAGMYASSITYYRVDEILIGSILAFWVHGKGVSIFKWSMPIFLEVTIFVLLCISCLQQGGFMNYLRPYLAFIVVGYSVFQRESFVKRLLNSRWLFVLSGLSFSLYIWHPILTETWLGQGDTYVKYAKRPLLVAVLLLVSVFSRNYIERPFIAIGRRISA